MDERQKAEFRAKIDWLWRYRRAVDKANHIAQRLAEAKSSAVRITPSVSSVRCQSRDGMSGAQRAVERIEALEGQLLDQREVCAGLYRETLRAVLVLPEPKERQVLRLRYLHGRAMDGIAAEMKITERQVRRIHRAAIEHLQCPP